MTRVFEIAIDDLVRSIRALNLIGMLGWHDIKQRYRRSMIGPFWLTISMGVMIGTIGLVFGHIFKTPVNEYLPFLAVGMIIWTFVSSVINEGCLSFVNAEGMIKQLSLPLSVHMARVVWRNMLILAHNLVIIPLLFLVMGISFGWSLLLSVPGLVILTLNLTWMALVLGLVCTRYRDLPQVVASLMQVAYFLTPIMWMPTQMGSEGRFLLISMNPAYHAIEIIRAPILGQVPGYDSWLFSVGLGVAGWASTIWVLGRLKRRVVYWL